MARPRKRLEAQTGHRTKEEKREREKQEELTKVSRNLKAPKWLNEEAVKIFNETVKLLNSIQVLDDLDVPLLSAYSDCYARLQKTASTLDIEGYKVIKESKNGSVEIVNPTVKVYIDLQKTLRDLSVKLGINSIDRTKLVQVDVKADEEDVFSKFL